MWLPEAEESGDKGVTGEGGRLVSGYIVSLERRIVLILGYSRMTVVNNTVLSGSKEEIGF